jgi:ribosomal protein S12 methylthiotransferase
VAETNSKEQKILMVSLGCDKNLVDSEEMLGQLLGSGYTMTDNEAEADAVIVNTCCFIEDAKKESIDTILSMAHLKEDGRCRALVVTGCLGHRYAREIQESIPEVDAIMGTSSADKIRDVLDDLLGRKQAQERARRAIQQEGPVVVVESADRTPLPPTRVITTGGWYEYLKIAEGCDKHCTYCAIPSVRGNYRSIPENYLLAQAKYLASQGVRELILVAQETMLYGTDISGKKELPKLLHDLAAIDGIEWIRILYCYPEEITEELIRTIRQEPKVLPYIDIPVQHASDHILKRMARRTSRADLERIICRLREEIPEIALRTTLIVGFPGETDEDFEELVTFVRKMRFDRLGVFTYSREEGTPAADFPDQIPEEVKQKRRDTIMEIQQEVSRQKNETLVGKTLEVITEGYLPDDGVYTGRTYRDAPGVDGLVFFESDADLISGTMADVKITGASEYDLTGIMTESTT